MAEATTEFETRGCFRCGKTSTVELTATEADKIAAGEKVQHIFPTRDADFRELIISGTHPECWAAMFPAEDED